MRNTEQIRSSILERLATVIDPETGVDVVSMRLIEDLTVEENGYVSYKFRPSSPLCPLAVPLSQEIYQTIAEVEGVIEQNMEVVGLLLAEELVELLKKEFGGLPDG